MRFSLSAISSGVSFLSCSTDFTSMGVLRMSRMTFCSKKGNQGRVEEWDASDELLAFIVPSLSSHWVKPDPDEIERKTNLILLPDLVEWPPDGLGFGERVGLDPAVRRELLEVLTGIERGIEVSEHGRRENDAFW
jgi:hypothetical protein